MLTIESALAKYSMYYYRYHLNQPLAGGLEKPSLPRTGALPIALAAARGGSSYTENCRWRLVWDTV